MSSRMMAKRYSWEAPVEVSSRWRVRKRLLRGFEMASKDWTKKEIVLWGLGMCGGAKGFVDTETVGVFLFEQHPGIFGLKTRPEYPDIDVARVMLADAKRNKGPDDPVRVTQDT